jgi:hypothetical protein
LAPKHDGISLMLIDMHQPGIETRPIALIAGASPFCETFFTDARAEKDNLVGPWNGGWTVGKRLLQFERSGGGGAGVDPWPGLGELAKRYLRWRGRAYRGPGPGPASSVTMDARVHALTLARVPPSQGKPTGPPTAPRCWKNSGHPCGPDPRRADAGDHGRPGPRLGRAFNREEIETVRGWLKPASRRSTAAFRSVNNIIKRILGLPDTTQSS